MKKLPTGWKAMRMADAGEIDGGRQRSRHLTDGQMRPYLRVANVMDGYIDVSEIADRLVKPEFRNRRCHCSHHAPRLSDKQWIGKTIRADEQCRRFYFDQKEL